MKKIGLVGLSMIIAAHISAVPYRKVSLACRNPGSHQDVAKTPIITNTTSHAISATSKIYWNASDGDHGLIYGPLAVNESKSGLGSAGNNYSCTAHYFVRISN